MVQFTDNQIYHWTFVNKHARGDYGHTWVPFIITLGLTGFKDVAYSNKQQQKKNEVCPYILIV